MDGDVALRVDDLSLHYGQSQILYDVSMTAAKGQVTCIMGTNGVGKTSLLKAVSGAHPRSQGVVTIEGKTLPSGRPVAAARAGLALVPQGREIFPLLTVRENLETGFACLSRDEHRIPDEVFDLFPVLKDMSERRGGDLSGGQQQQLAIARALIAQPKVLLLDEPTEGIQPNVIQQIGRVIQHLKERGDIAIVLVEQYFDFAFELGDMFNVMRRGRIEVAKSRDKITRDELLRAVSVAGEHAPA